MNLILESLLQEQERLTAESADLLTIVGDMQISELERAGADVRLALNDQMMTQLDGLIELHLERIPIEDYLDEINTNLSDKCH